MDKCSVCEIDLPNERIHLGYSECLKCSDTEKYSSHTVYPHKTGGYIQPMSSEQADNMKRLDRRGVSSNRKAKGILADNSWDRWLKEYLKPKEDKWETMINEPMKERYWDEKQLKKGLDSYAYFFVSYGINKGS